MDDGPRIDELRRLGLSETIIRTAAGGVVHDALWPVCLPLTRAATEPPAPSGIRFIPLWQFAGGVTGVEVRDDGVAFADYAIDRPQDGFVFVAGTEQGLLAYVLSHVVDEHLAGAAEAVGFRFLPELQMVSDIEALRSLIGRIDGRCDSVGQAAPGAAGDGGPTSISQVTRSGPPPLSWVVNLPSPFGACVPR